MAYKIKPQEQGRGSLFINNFKNLKKHPDYRGTINLTGETEEIAAWKKRKELGQTYLVVIFSTSKIEVELHRNSSRNNDKAPAYKSGFVFNDVDYNLSGWLNKTHSEVEYLSLKVEEVKKYEKHNDSDGNEKASPVTGFGDEEDNPYPTTEEGMSEQPTEEQTEVGDDLPF